MQNATTARPARTAAKRSRPSSPPGGETVKTWAFDSVGTRKYALQIRKASNGNPCLKIVEGIPQPDGTFRKFNVTVWSEDFGRLFALLDEVRAYMAEHNIRTPDGHKYDPNAVRGLRGGQRGRQGGARRPEPRP